MHNLQQVQVRTSNGFEKICPFPVGYIYMSTNDTSPASTYGGTWSPLSDSRFLRPSGSWNNQGGEEAHKLTTAEMPNHQHAANSWWEGSGSIRVTSTGWAYRDSGTSTANPQNIGTYHTGGSQPHNNIPPYRTCYCWYRTA